MIAHYTVPFTARIEKFKAQFKAVDRQLQPIIISIIIL